MKKCSWATHFRHTSDCTSFNKLPAHFLTCYVTLIVLSTPSGCIFQIFFFPLSDGLLTSYWFFIWNKNIANFFSCYKFNQKNTKQVRTINIKRSQPKKKPFHQKQKIQHQLKHFHTIPKVRGFNLKDKNTFHRKAFCSSLSKSELTNMC